MSSLKYILINIAEALLRMLPLPSKCGLIKIGNPDRNSPVFLTGNYHLTVMRVKRTLRDLNAYLIVANSKGVNVWCAAAGGLLSHHDVISVLKTSGIERLVDHRQVVLPQLAAPGVEAGQIRKKTGWQVVWGPIYAKDIPEYVHNRFIKTPSMSQVEFAWRQRIESAVFWAFPMSVLALPLILLFNSQVFLKTLGLIWTLALTLLLVFPLYDRFLDLAIRVAKRFSLRFGQGVFQFLLWSVVVGPIALINYWQQDFDWASAGRWGVIVLLVIVVLTFDLKGFTPIYRGDLLEGRYSVRFDKERCKGLGWCEQVCPRGCFQMDNAHKIATMQHIDTCIRCSACIVQCTRDALSFKNQQDEIIPPETIRKFKLNLMGKRDADNSAV